MKKYWTSKSKQANHWPRWEAAIAKLAYGKRIQRGPVTDKVAVIIEPRNTKLLLDILNWMMHLLAPSGWTFIIYCGLLNVATVTQFRDTYGLSDILDIRKLMTNNLTVLEYNSMLMSESFWVDIPKEHILIFQTDSVVLDANIDKFLQYDYVGAPWRSSLSWFGNRPSAVGNGGLSLRTKSGMLRAIRNVPHLGENEDMFYAIKSKHLLKIPTATIGSQFSVESIYYPTPAGVHKFWGFLTENEIDKIFAYINSKTN